jgi:hypothetical protein
MFDMNFRDGTLVIGHIPGIIPGVTHVHVVPRDCVPVAALRTEGDSIQRSIEISAVSAFSV